jgi:hypothetical protein
MPQCLKCKDSFPNRIKIEQKYHVIANRKYCLHCSPFKAHNTKTLHKNIKRTTQRQYKTNWTTSFRLERKKILFELIGGKCRACAYSRCTRAIHFHHVIPDEKKFELNVTNLGRPWKVLLEEASKTVCFCSNCHAEVHAGLHPQLLDTIAKEYMSRNRQDWIDSALKNIPQRRNGVNRISQMCRCSKIFVPTHNAQKYCSLTCTYFYQRKVKRPDQKTLLSEIESMSLVQIGKKYGVSDNAVRKWIKQIGETTQVRTEASTSTVLRAASTP